MYSVIRQMEKHKHRYGLLVCDRQRKQTYKLNNTKKKLLEHKFLTRMKVER